jgi:predicted metalloprotease with PDZ domain
MKRLSVLLAAITLFASMPGIAQTQANAAAGAVELTVRMPHPEQKLLYVHEVMPVEAGPLTLYYPKYIPGDHSPDGPIGTMMGLEISANGKRIAWHRDEVDMFTFHLTVPPDAHQIDIRFEFPADGRATRDLLDLTWDHVALYRAGSPTRDQIYQPTLVIPADWRYASALTTEAASNGRITFKPVPFNTLVDSPVIAGKYFREIDLTPPGSSVHRYLDMVGDDAAVLGISDREIAGYRKLIEQAQALFQSHHYNDYHVLLVLSDYTSRGGLEHHQSSDDRSHIGAGMFADADHFLLSASFVPHEYVHSWNGKFMRPAKLWQPDFESPEHSRMLWMYESLTVYLGDVLTVRSGLWSPETWRQVVAYRGAVMAHQTGREWRPLIDTTIAAQLLYGSPKAWANWRRQTDFYREGEFLWLAVDTKIRQLSHDRRSLDDFAKRFFGRDNGSFVTHTYSFDDVVHALSAVQPYDWSGFLHNWLDGVDGEVPLLSGVESSGWRLAYTDKPSRFQNALENVGPGELSPSGVNAMFSVGLFLDHKGKIEDVLWNGPAFKAGLAPGMQVVSIDGASYSTTGLRADIAKAKGTNKPLQIRVRADGHTETHAVDYYGGPKYPHLMRVSGKPDYLKQILAPLPTSATTH